MADFEPTSLTIERRPKYEQVRRLLLDGVRSGRLSRGNYLPGESELAQHLGVARNTVRRALAELESQQMVRRVRGRRMIVNDHRERPEVVSNLFALVLPHIAEGMYASLQSGFGGALASQQGQMVVCNAQQDVGRQADSVLRLVDQGVAGLAIVPVSVTATPGHHLRFLRRLNVPLVFCHRRVPDVPGPLVAFSGLEICRLAGRRLAQAGHRRVAYFAAHDYEMPRLYEKGLRETIERAGGRLLPQHVHYAQWAIAGPASSDHVAQVRAALRQMIAEPDRPTAVMVSFDNEALVIHLLARQLGLRIPEDLSIIGFGGTVRGGAVAASGLTSVVVDEEKLGETAATWLTEMVAGVRPLTDSSEIYIPVSISPGATLAPPAA